MSVIHPYLIQKWIDVILTADEECFIDQESSLIPDLEIQGLVGYYDGYQLTLTGQIIYTFLTGRVLGDDE